MLKALLEAPRAPVLIGLLGLIPFAIATLAFIVNASASDQAQFLVGYIGIVSVIAYGAVILSFLGGTRWGLAIANRPNGPAPLALTWSVLPSLVGWAALVISVDPVRAPHYGVIMMMGAYGMMLAWDLSTVRAGVWPDWYGPLRVVLTLGAIGALGITLGRWFQVTMVAPPA